MTFGEPTLTPGYTLWLLSPELVLLCAGLLMLGSDALHPHGKDRRWLPYVALAGLTGALIATLTLWECDTRVLSILTCDTFALTCKVLALVAVGIVVLSADTYVHTRIQHQGQFYALLLFSTLTICLLAGATNLILFFLAFDFLSITSYVLTGYLHDDQRSSEAAIKYFLYGAALSAVMLYGMSWFYGLTGTTDLGGIATVIRETEGTARPLLIPALIFMAAGFAFKIGAVPFHQWAPDAYEGAPTPVTAFLSVGPPIAGFAIIMRVMPTALPIDLKHLAADWQTLLMALATLTMTVGNLVALWQQNIKRLLAYSSISHAGYVLIGVVTASSRGMTAGLFYLAAYVLANLGAFAAVIAFSNQTGSDAIAEYAGLSKRAPALALALLICLLSLAGIPPTAGFIGKMVLFSTAIEKGLLWLAIVGVVNSIIAFSYCWKIIRTTYLDPPRAQERLSTPLALAIATGLTAAGVLIAGVFPSPLLELMESAAQTIFGG